MTIKVFDINENVYEEQLVPEDVDNIQKIFNKIFASSNTDHQKIECFTSDSSIIKKYHDSENFDLTFFANELLKAEKKKDSTRNKQITRGFLFVKKESDVLQLLKLESIETIDKDQHYKMRDSFSTVSNYYKGCLFSGNLKNVTVIDKNTTVAGFWRDKFLGLELNRNEYQDSMELISLIHEDELFSEQIKNQENFQEIKSKTEDFLFGNENFDKTQLADNLRRNNLIELTDLNKIYSEESKKLNAQFQISNKAIAKSYKKTIQVSKETKIFTDNYAQLKKRNGIKFENGRLILTVSEAFLKNIPDELMK
ncbi:hypothetical protein I6G50_05590 [Lactococcus garvieae]|nr:hypothetical protein I6G50_05590 [Lactococcus garvieae]